MIRFGSVPFLQLLEHQHLVLVRAVDAGLARGHALAGHDDGLHAHQELIVAIDAGRRRDHDAAGGAVDGDDRPRGKRRSGQDKQGNQGEKGSFHGRQSYAITVRFLRCLMRAPLSFYRRMRGACWPWSSCCGCGAQTPTFAKDVAPIFYSKCVECHRPTMFAPMSLVKYRRSAAVGEVDSQSRVDADHAAVGRRSRARRLQERSAAVRQGDRDHPRVGRRRRAEGRRQGPADGAVVRRRLDDRPARRRVRDDRRRSRSRRLARSSISTSAFRPASPKTSGWRRSRSSRRPARRCIT